MFPCMHKCNAGCDPALHLCNGGSDRLHVHRNFVRGNEKYNIFDFGENRTERHVTPHTIFEDPWMPGAGSDRLHAHRNIVRCAEKYNIFDFEENRTSHCFGTVSFEKCRCYFGTNKFEKCRCYFGTEGVVVNKNYDIKDCYNLFQARRLDFPETPSSSATEGQPP